MTTERPEPVEPRPVEPMPPTAQNPPAPTAALEPVEPVRATRRLNGETTRRTRTSRPAKATVTTVPREHTTALLAALGDVTHPLHANAVDELVALGPAIVPALSATLQPDQPWLAVYRATEVAGRIGDGRATSALIQALGHANSNVRWGAVRALAQIGDVRALIELRRVAQQDQGRTTWGESVGGAAQSALNELSQRSLWGQSLELVKTATAAIMMLAALIFAFSTVSTLRAELDRFGQVIPGQNDAPLLILPTAAPSSTNPAAQPTSAAASVPTALPEPTAVPEPTAELPALAPTGGALGGTGVFGTIIRDANIRAVPSTENNQPIGRLFVGQEVEFLAQTANGQWFRIAVSPQASAGAQLNTPDGTGWVSQSLVSPPTEALPIEEPLLPSP